MTTIISGPTVAETLSNRCCICNQGVIKKVSSDHTDYSKTGRPLMKADHHDKIYHYCDRCFHVSSECQACDKRTKDTNLIIEEIAHCVDGCENQVDDYDYKSVYY